MTTVDFVAILILDKRDFGAFVRWESHLTTAYSSVK